MNAVIFSLGFILGGILGFMICAVLTLSKIADNEALLAEFKKKGNKKL